MSGLLFVAVIVVVVAFVAWRKKVNKNLTKSGSDNYVKPDWTSEVDKVE